MTDAEKLISLLKDFGIHYIKSYSNLVENKGNMLIEIYQANDAWRVTDNKQIQNDIQKNGNKVDGYTGFYTSFEFDEKGKFVQMGICE